MARAKKEAALTPEERLQAALVPDWEWPYKLPENWCWLKLVESFDNHTDSKKKIKQKDYLAKGKLAVVDQGQELIGGYTNDVEKSYSGALPIVIFGDHTRCIKFVDFPFAQGADGVKVLRPKPFYLPKAFYYALQSVNIPNLGYRRHFPLFNKFSIPLPPFAEQQRMVDRIESLFAKLDETKEKAQAVVDRFETRKAAILHKAFTGELTAKWREEHGVSIDNWKTTRFDSVAAIRSNLVDPAEYQSFPHIAPDNIEKKTGVLLEYHTIAEDGVTSGKHRFYSGQILYSKIRPYLSKAVVVDFDGLCSADMYPIEAYQNARCLWYYMLSDEFLLQASTAGSRSVLPKINQKELSALTVHLPTNDREQEEIARILDELFDKEQQTKEAAEIVLDQIELMKKSILARAFRGELGTNDPSEESAVELIKQIKQDSLGKISGDTLEKKRVKKKVEVGLVAKSIMQALSAGAKLTPENLKAETALPIDDFYDQLKILINGGHVIETRIDGESYLEAKDENR